MTEDSTTRKKGELPDRPDPEDIIYGELNLERWPNIWSTTDGKEIRSLRRQLRYPDGNAIDTTLSVIPSPAAGDLTADTCKIFSVLLAIRQEMLGPRALANVGAERIPLALRNVAERLSPSATRTSSWGGFQHASILKHLEKLNGVNLKFEGSFWNAKKQTRQTFKGGFNLISDYYVLEERRFQKGNNRQLPLELGHFRLNPFVIENLAMGYHAPFYLSERLSLSGFALVLYNQLDMKMATHDRYERNLTELFEYDFPEMGEKYRAPFHRERALRRAIDALKDKRLTSGKIIDLRIIKRDKVAGKKLVVRKTPFALRLVDATVAPTDEQALRNLLVDDILTVTRDKESTAFYHLVVRNLDEFTVRRFLAEIRADGMGDFRGSIGQLLFVKVRDYCRDNRIEPFWQAR